MKIKNEFEAPARVSACLTDQGEFSVKVFASAEYEPGTGKTATAESAVPEDLQAELAIVLGKILKDAEDKLGRKLNHAIYVAKEAAQRMGESAA